MKLVNQMLDVFTANTACFLELPFANKEEAADRKVCHRMHVSQQCEQAMLG